MKEIDLSIIIISFNTKDLTLACLKSIFSHVKEIAYEVIVVDNNSKDDSVREISKLESKIPNLKLIINKENLGFSRANNIGVKHSTGRYVLFLNSDTLVPKKTLEYMINFMDKHTQAGAATCFVRLKNGKLDDAAHRGFPTPWNALCHFSGLAKIFPRSLFFNGYHLGWKDLDKMHEIDALAGAFMIVRRAAGEQTGWWDEDYFFYGEDIDFCYKLKERGWKIYFVPEVEILHLKGASSGIKKESQKITTASIETKRWVTNHRFEAMKIFYRKHYLHKYPYLVTRAIMLAIDLKKFFSLRSL
jgi:GT2 family glycosyltransferase